MTSVLLSKYLDPKHRAEIATDLAKDLRDIDNVTILNELLDNLDEETKLSLSTTVSEFFKGELLKPECYIQEEPTMLTLASLPGALADVLQWCEEVLEDVVKKQLGYSFSAGVSAVVANYIEFEEDTKAIELEETTLLQVLNFLERVYSLADDADVEIPGTLDKLVLLFTCFKDDEVSTKAIKTLRFRDFAHTELHQYIWDLTSIILAKNDDSSSSSSTSQQMSNVYITWLRLLISLQKSHAVSATITAQHQTEQYWKFIQQGLISHTHEHRKYALSILKLSIQQITQDIDNEYIHYAVATPQTAIDAWKRFCTLYEIIGIDTALNQAAAARSDILSLLSLSSPIKPSWGLALLSTGFKANMESVRKFALECMYLVKAEDLAIFGNAFLCDVFLRYASEAHHFQVRALPDQDGELSCPYGAKLETFVKGLLKALKGNGGSLLYDTVAQLVGYLVELSASFAPARIYLTNGLFKGLRTPILRHQQVSQIYKLFESSAEDAIFEKYLQTIHLKLLTKVQADVGLVLDSLVKFVQHNGWELYLENMEVFLDYISVHHDPAAAQEEDAQFATREAEFQVVYYSLFGKYAVSEEFLKTLALSKLPFPVELNSEFSRLLTGLIHNNSGSSGGSSGCSSYTDSEVLVDLSIFAAASFKDLDLTNLSQFTYTTRDFDIEKFKFFAKVYTKVIEVSDNSPIFTNPADLVQLANDLAPLYNHFDFKTSDVVKAQFLTILQSFLQSHPIEDASELNTTLLAILSKNVGFYHSNVKLCQIVQYLITNYTAVIDLITVMEILESVWDSFSAERLVLNQLPMHLTFIETLYHEVILKDCINNEYNSKVLQSVALQIIEFAQSRRSLLPALSASLWRFSKYYKAEFELSEWLFPVLIKIMRIIQDETNVFRLKAVIGLKFDRELAFGQGNVYESVYGDQEISAKIHIISILSESSNAYASDLFEYLVKDDPFHIVSPVKKTDGLEEMQRLFSFGVLLLISQRVNKQILSNYVSTSLIPALESETSPLVRSYMEWIISLESIGNTANRTLILEKFKDQSKPSLVTSVERIAFLISQKLPPNSDETKDFFESFTAYLIPNCSSNKPLIRHFSNSLILSIYPEIQSRGLILPIDPVLRLLYEEAKKSESTGKYRSGDALIWDIEQDYNLAGIFGGVLGRITPRDIRMITKSELDQYFKGDDNNGIPIGSEVKPDWSTDATHAADEQGGDSQLSQTNSTLQTKSGAWETVIDLSEQTRQVKRTKLIVVSSLVDKPPNLGGICRLCDVLGAGLMTVDDLRVKQHPQFKNVAVTADHWMPLEEVKIPDIPEFMKQKKREGYTLIGLEQTDKSIVLGHETPFPEKSLILLGREAEGIPGELLAELDYCVEIRQLGVIRSMNIQTATAVIVHAYSSAQTHLHKN